MGAGGYGGGVMGMRGGGDGYGGGGGGMRGGYGGGMGAAAAMGGGMGECCGSVTSSGCVTSSAVDLKCCCGSEMLDCTAVYRTTL